LKIAFGALLAIALLGSSAPVRAEETWNGLPDRFQIDTGYFRLTANTVLRFDGPAGGAGDIDFEQDLGLDENVNTFWIDATWRVGRRHQLKLGFTRLNRERGNYTLQRDFTWGGETYSAGLEASSFGNSDILGGYYRFAIVRNDRFELGPTIGVGYLSLEARIEATGTVQTPAGPQTRNLDEAASVGSVTGAIGGYAKAWPAKRLSLQADYLYIKVSPGESEASVTDWRVAANVYVSRHVGLGAQYKYNRYSYDRGILVSKLGGEVEFKGFQAFLSFLF
jgi:hypothetical protein